MKKNSNKKSNPTPPLEEAKIALEAALFEWRENCWSEDVPELISDGITAIRAAAIWDKKSKQNDVKMRQALNAALSWCKGDASAGLSLFLDKDCINARIKRLTDALK